MELHVAMCYLTNHVFVCPQTCYLQNVPTQIPHENFKHLTANLRFSQQTQNLQGKLRLLRIDKLKSSMATNIKKMAKKICSSPSPSFVFNLAMNTAVELVYDFSLEL